MINFDPCPIVFFIAFPLSTSGDMRRHSRTLCYDFPAICGGIRRIPMDNHQPWHFRRFIRVPRCDLWLWFLKCPIDVLRLSTGVESYVGTIWYNDIQCTHKTGYSWLFYVILRIGNHLGLIILTLTASCHPTYLKAP